MAASRFSMAGTAQSCVIMDGRELTLEQPLRGSGEDTTCNKIGMIPSILITHGFCFLDGKRTEWNKLSSWHAHDDDLGITSADEPKSIQSQSCENEPTREVRIEDDNTAFIFIQFHRSTCIKKTKENLYTGKGLGQTLRDTTQQHVPVFPMCRMRYKPKSSEANSLPLP